MDLPPQQIVGVVDDMRQARFDREPAPQYFVPYRQVLALTQARKMPVPAQERLAFGFLSFVVRTEGDPAQLMGTVRSLVGKVDANVGIDAMLPMEELVSSSASMACSPTPWRNARGSSASGPRWAQAVGMCSRW